MIALQNQKTGLLIFPQAIVDNDYWAGSHQHGATNNNLDCRGWRYARIEFWLGATDIAVAELSLYESDDGSTWTKVSESDYAVNGALPSADADNSGVAWFVDLRKRKRYLRINAKAGNGTAGSYAICHYTLDRGEEMPSTTAQLGLSQKLIF